MFRRLLVSSLIYFLKILKVLNTRGTQYLILIQMIYNAAIFSKFDMKSGFWQIQIKSEGRYKTTFTVPFGNYEWNVMPFGLKNAPSEFQNMMNNIFNYYLEFSIVYIDDVLIFSNYIEEHFKHLKIFKKL